MQVPVHLSNLGEKLTGEELTGEKLTGEKLTAKNGEGGGKLTRLLYNGIFAEMLVSRMNTSTSLLLTFCLTLLGLPLSDLNSTQ